MSLLKTLKLQEKRIAYLEYQLFEKQAEIDGLEKTKESLCRALDTAFDAAESSRLLSIKLDEMMAALKSD